MGPEGIVAEMSLERTDQEFALGGLEGRPACLATVPTATRPSAVALSNSSNSASSCDFHHAASSASFAKVLFFNSSRIAIPFGLLTLQSDVEEKLKDLISGDKYLIICLVSLRS